jgi:hypothetical protein
LETNSFFDVVSLFTVIVTWTTGEMCRFISMDAAEKMQIFVSNSVALSSSQETQW